MERLGPWMPDTDNVPPVALAVSGGGDSMALAMLASTWRKHLVAFIVDHGLRPEFEQEAATAMETLLHLGIPVTRLAVKSLPYGSGLADRARKARYAELIAACRQVGAVDLLVAHQADDQVETVAMRRERGSGTGLSGMAAITELADIRIVRPLLGYSRETLRHTLRHAGLQWCDDPSNQNEQAERVRVRKHLDCPEKNALWQLATQAAVSRTAYEDTMAVDLVQAGCHISCGWVVLGSALPSPETLAALVRCIGGRDYAPSLESIREICLNEKQATVGGARLIRRKSEGERPDQWLLVREAATIQDALPADDGALWDRRFRLRCKRPLPNGCFIGAAGTGIRRPERQGLPAVVTGTLPALWKDGERMCVPHLGLYADEAFRDVSFDFVPPSPVTAANRWMNIYLTSTPLPCMDQ